MHITDPSFLLAVASVFELAGGILIAVVVFSVHQHIAKERSIDEDVLSSMRAERAYIATGIALLIVSFVIEIGVWLAGAPPIL